MANDTITIAFEGDVPLHIFAKAMGDFHQLIAALTEEVAHAPIDWAVHDLQYSSAMATVKGRYAQIRAVERVVEAYGEVGSRLQKNEAIPYSEKVVRPARNLTRVLDGRITSVRFETPIDAVTVASPSAKLTTERLSAYGAVEGEVQTLSKARGLRFSLLDTVSERLVSCYLPPDAHEEETMRGIWGRRAIVEGLVTRDPVTGRPVAVHNVRRVTPTPDTQGGYQHARAILPLGDGDLMPEDLVRTLRDAE
ncbi:MAG: hypothetical protein WEB00_08040 [Dehalococcoidia bacterium]